MATTQLVIFELNGEEYGINALAVNGILRSKKFQIRKVPGLPKIIEGMIRLRGDVNYIFNLGTILGVKETQTADESKFIMFNVRDSVAGCIVDEVTDIVTLDDQSLQPAPNFMSGLNARYFSGIGKVDDRMIIILDPEQILSLEEYDAVPRI